jgi:FkbM family methyltransferase
MTIDKPKSPYPPIVRRLLKRLLPATIYQQYIGRHENGSLRIWSQLASSLDDGTVVLDIGSYHGEYALATRKINLQTEIYSFEPNPLNLTALQENVAGKNIRVEKIAVAEKDGEVSFSIDSATSRILLNSDSTVAINFVQVTAVCLDTWVAANEVYPSLIKIDTEGFEAAILRGAKWVLEKYYPIILCEVLTDAAGLAVMEALPKGYVFYCIDENNGIEIRNVITRKEWRNHNWLLMPESKKYLVI